MAEYIIVSSSPSWLKAELPNQRVLYNFSGIEILPNKSFVGQKPVEWTHEVVQVQFAYPELPPGKALLVDYWVPTATISSCSLKEFKAGGPGSPGTNLHGWAVDKVDVAVWIRERKADRFCHLNIHAAIKGMGEVHRIAWTLNVAGRIVNYQGGGNN